MLVCVEKKRIEKWKPTSTFIKRSKLLWKENFTWEQIFWCLKNVSSDFQANNRFQKHFESLMKVATKSIFGEFSQNEFSFFHHRFFIPSPQFPSRSPLEYVQSTLAFIFHGKIAAQGWHWPNKEQLGWDQVRNKSYWGHLHFACCRSP